MQFKKYQLNWINCISFYLRKHFTNRLPKLLTEQKIIELKINFNLFIALMNFRKKKILDLISKFKIQKRFSSCVWLFRRITIRRFSLLFPNTFPQFQLIERIVNAWSKQKRATYPKLILKWLPSVWWLSANAYWAILWIFWSFCIRRFFELLAHNWLLVPCWWC